MIRSLFKLSPLVAAAALGLASLPARSQPFVMCQHPGSGPHAAIEQICPYRDGLAAFKVGGSWGLLDKNGNVVLEPAYEWMDGYSEGLAEVRSHDEKTGYVNRKGELVLPLKYDSGRSFSEGLAPVEVGGKWGYIDRLGQWVIEPRFEDAYPFHAGVAIVQDDHRSLRLISRDGETLHRLDGMSWVSSRGFNRHGLAVVEVRPPGQFVHVDGRSLTIPIGVDVTGPLVAGRLPASVRIDGQAVHGLMALDGRWAVPPTWGSLEWKGRLAQVSASGDHDPAYGLIDAQGKVVVEPRYSYMQHLEGLYFASRREGAQQRIDVLNGDGRVIAPALDCGHVQPRRLSIGIALLGCEKTIVLDDEGEQISLPIERVEEFRAAAGGAVLVQGPEAEHGADGVRMRSFALLDAQGKVLLTSDDASVKGAYDEIRLLAGQGQLAEAAPHLLPLAVLTRGYERIAIVTHEGRVVTRPEWEYDIASTGEGYLSEDEVYEGPLPMKTASGFGAIDGQGEWVIAPRFKKLGEFRNGTAFAEKLGRELVVDNTGGVHAFPEDGFRFGRTAPFVLEGVDREQRIVRLDVRRKTVVRTEAPADGTQATVRARDFVEGLAPAQQDERWGLVDERGGWVVPARYTDRPEPLMHGGRLQGWRVQAEVELRHPVSPDSRRDRRHGLLGPRGDLRLPAVYDSINWDGAHPDLVSISLDGRNGIAKPDGTVVLEPAHEFVKVLGEGWLAVTPASRKGLMNTRGAWVLPPSHFDLDRDDGTYTYDTDGMDEWLVDEQGRVSTPAKPQTQPGETADRWWRNIERDASYRERTVFYGFDWRQRLSVDGEVGSDFSEGRAVVDKGRDGGKVLIDSLGRALGRLPFDEVEPMHDGRAVVAKDTAPKRGEEPVRRYGYVDNQARLAIPPRFEWAGPFSEDRATVARYGNLAVIDKAGRVIVQGAWMCGTRPVLVNARQQIVWPKDIDPALLKSRRCP